MFVAPDGASIAVNASSIASVITNSTGYRHGELDLRPDAAPGDRARFRRALRELGRPPLSYNRFVQGDVIAGDHRRARRRHRPRRSDRRRSPSLALAFAGNLSADGRYVLFQTTAVIGRRHRRARRPLRPRSRRRRRRHGEHVGDAVRAESVHGRRCRGRSRRRRRHQSRGVPARQPPEGLPHALPRRRRQQQLLPDRGRRRQSGPRGGDRGDALPRRQRPQLVGRRSRSPRASRAASPRAASSRPRSPRSSSPTSRSSPTAS